MLITLAILLDGIVFASYLFLVSIGLTLIFGVMKILNAAHGSFYAFGAYGTASVLGMYFAADRSVAGAYVLMVLVAIVIQINVSTSTDARVARNDVGLTAMDLAIESVLHARGQVLSQRRVLVVGSRGAIGACA